MKGYTTCPKGCTEPVVTALLTAHLRRHEGTDWFSERRPIITPRPGLGSRSRRDLAPDGGEGAPQRRWARPRPNAPYTIKAKGRPSS